MNTKKSLPARGAWVETRTGTFGRGKIYRRSPQGERGLKRRGRLDVVALVERRSPQGERGLKHGDDARGA